MGERRGEERSLMTVRSRVMRKQCAEQLCVLRSGARIRRCPEGAIETVSHWMVKGYGTLGGVFQDKEGGRRFGVTNVHVIAEGKDSTETELLGVEICTTDFSVGRVVAVMREYDAAWIEIDSDVHTDCTLPPGGLDDAGTPVVLSGIDQLRALRNKDDKGQLVMKYGARTGWSASKGTRHADGSLEDVAVINFNMLDDSWDDPKEAGRVCHQRVMTDFALNGDSGALMLDQHLRVVGLLYVPDALVLSPSSADTHDTHPLVPPAPSTGSDPVVTPNGTCMETTHAQVRNVDIGCIAGCLERCTTSWRFGNTRSITTSWVTIFKRLPRMIA